MKRKLKSNVRLKNRGYAWVQSIAFFLACGLMLSMMACSGKDSTHESDSYTCPMHPTVVSDRPGSCPVCGMDLVRKARPGEEVEITEELARLIKSPNETVLASIKTIKAEYGSLPVTMDVQGVITYDTKRIYSIPSRVGGRLEKVYLKYAFQQVSRGQKIAEIYSPELITAQREFLFVLENERENTERVSAAKRKISFLGLSEAQINTLIKSGEVQNSFGIYSAHSGYVITDRPAPSTSSAGAGDGMGGDGGASSGGDPAASNASGVLIREGTYVTAGQTLFNVANDDALRIEFDLPASRAASVKKGDSIVVDFGNGMKEETSIDFVQPFFSRDQDFFKVRVFVPNSEGLHIGHLVTARVSLSSTESMWVPNEAVVDLGSDKIVFVKDKGKFTPKKVRVGFVQGDKVEILSGLASADEIAANAQFLVDSESFVRVK